MSRYELDEKDFYIACKWPQMYVTGKSISVDAARDIILRSNYDDFLYGNTYNMRDQFKKEFRALIKEPELEQIDKGFNNLSEEVREKFLDNPTHIGHAWSFKHAIKNEIKNNLKSIYDKLEYVYNDQIFSAFCLGAHGWCNPNGEIFYEDNIGKWPDTYSVLRDWKVIAREWPFLDINITLFDGERCDEGTKPIFNIRVSDGNAVLCQPDFSVHPQIERPERSYGCSIKSSLSINELTDIAMVIQGEYEKAIQKFIRMDENIYNLVKQFRNL